MTTKTKLKITAALLAYCLAIPALCAFLESQEADASRSSAQAKSYPHLANGKAAAKLEGN